MKSLILALVLIQGIQAHAMYRIVETYEISVNDKCDSQARNASGVQEYIPAMSDDEEFEVDEEYMPNEGKCLVTWFITK